MRLTSKRVLHYRLFSSPSLHWPPNWARAVSSTLTMAVSVDQSPCCTEEGVKVPGRTLMVSAPPVCGARGGNSTTPVYRRVAGAAWEVYPCLQELRWNRSATLEDAPVRFTADGRFALGVLEWQPAF
jgi:hypothetical protein